MSNSNLSKILSVMLIVLMVVSVGLLLLFYKATSDIPAETDFDTQIELYGSTLDVFMYWAYLLFGIAAVSAVIFPIVRLFTRPKEAIKSLISVVVIAVFIAIAYSLSDGTILHLPGYDGPDNVPGTLKFADTMIFTTYFLLVVAVLSIVYAEVSKALK
ncbi:MAG: hypothetical protein JXR51_15660 [Bacteroidales bacterium]|nr:hypothetical protein [Bacteroidales bacterium]